jgi:hypothetical protein
MSGVERFFVALTVIGFAGLFAVLVWWADLARHAVGRLPPLRNSPVRFRQGPLGW